VRRGKPVYNQILQLPCCHELWGLYYTGSTSASCGEIEGVVVVWDFVGGIDWGS